MDALRDDDGIPKFNMLRGLIFEAVVAIVAVPWFFFVKRSAGRLAMDVNARYH
jgi:hypothetical protein